MAKRNNYQISQLEASTIVGVPLRTYIRYETSSDYGNALKRNGIIAAIKDKCEITEEKGILTIDQIIEGVRNVITEKYRDSVSFCYLFGSYSKGYATAKSDIDLLVDTNLQGFAYAGLAEDIRAKLHKNIDLNNFVNSSSELIHEIMKEGIKIYG